MRSSDRLLDILEELAREPGQTLTQLSQALELPKPTALRFLRALQERGWVSQFPDGAYELSPHLGDLISSTAARDTLTTRAAPFVHALRDSLDESVGINTLIGHSRMCVLDASSGQPNRFVHEPFVRRYLHAGASGKVLLAFGAPTVRSAVLRRPLSAYTDKTMTSAADLLAELSRVKHSGWAVSRGERRDGSVAVAVPVRDSASGRVHSLAILGPESRYNAAVHDNWVAALHDCAAAIEHSLAS